MQIPENYNDVKPSTFSDSKSPPAGPYVMGILRAEETTSKSGNSMFVMTLDIAKGEFKNFYSQLSLKIGKDCYPKIYQLTSGDNVAYFKGMMISIEDSNPGFKFNFDEKTLVRKLVGVMMREEEYVNSKGEAKSILKPLYTCSVKRVEAGEMKTPDPKKLSGSDRPVPSSESNTNFGVDDGQDDLPF